MTILCALLALLIAYLVITNLVITITSLYNLTINIVVLYGIQPNLGVPLPNISICLKVKFKICFNISIFNLIHVF